LLGEFAWSVENLLNRVINQTLAVDAAIVQLIEEAVAALPALIEQLEVGIAPQQDIQRLIARAEALADGRAEPAPAGAAPAADAADGSADMDPVLARFSSRSCASCPGGCVSLHT
jgi:chemosensory pili system protein ChpA (sensor histidine kinase/response regulator)